KAVLPPDLLALFVGSSPITDAHFINAKAALGDLDSDFGLKTKTVFLNGDGLNDFAAEDFVAGLHIAEIEVGQRVGHEGQDHVPHRVPEVKYAMRSAAQKAGTVNDIGFALEQGLQKGGIFGGIVFQVGILNDDEVTRSFSDAAAQGSTFS